MAKQIQYTKSLVLSKNSFEAFAAIQQEIIQSADSELELLFDIEKRLGLTFVYCLSVLPFLAKDREKTLVMKANQKTINFLHKTGCIKSITGIIEKETDIVPILEKDAKQITGLDDILNLVTQITKEAPVKMDENLTAIFTSKIGEMYINSREHADAKFIIGAKYFKAKKGKGVYCFSCYDTGIGIPKKIMSKGYASNPTAAFKWAMKRGNSTESPPRGLGLHLLQNFAKLNKGNIRLCSGNVLYLFDGKKGEVYYKLKNKFEGTLFEMDIIADNDYMYVLK